MGKVEIPESELRQHKADGKTDAEIGQMYGADMAELRRKLER